jgi:hypothetical protein
MKIFDRSLCLFGFVQFQKGTGKFALPVPMNFIF